MNGAWVVPSCQPVINQICIKLYLNAIVPWSCWSLWLHREVNILIVVLNRFYFFYILFMDDSHKGTIRLIKLVVIVGVVVVVVRAPVVVLNMVILKTSWIDLTNLNFYGLWWLFTMYEESRALREAWVTWHIHSRIAWLTAGRAQQVPIQPMMEPASVIMAAKTLMIRMHKKMLSIVLMSLQLCTMNG